jgi:acyl-CoA thioester hydrolase
VVLVLGSVGSAVVTAAFTHPVQVRYHEIDQQGVVFNMWYLAYLDEAMSAFIEANGLAYTHLQDDGFDVRWCTRSSTGPRRCGSARQPA